MDRLHSKELPDFPSTRVRIQPSQAKHKLFIGGIPHELSREELKDMLDPIVKGEAGGLAGGGWVSLRAAGCELGCGTTGLRG